MIAAPLPAPPAAGPAQAPSPGSPPTAETLASAFAGLLALLTGTSPPATPMPNGPAGQARPSAAPGAPAVAGAPQGLMTGEAGAMPTAPTASGPAISATGRGGVVPPGPGPTEAKLPTRQGPAPETIHPGQVLSAPPVETAALAAAGGERAVDPQLALTPLRPVIEAPAGTGSPNPTAPPPPSPAAPPSPGSQIQLQITRAVTEHVDHIRVRLEPPELGHVEIKLHVGDDHRFTGMVTVERSETLDLLQREAAALERGLREAGLRPDGGGLSFTLRRDQQEGAGGQQNASGNPQQAADDAPAELAPEGSDPAPGVGLLRMLDIRA